MLCYVMGFQMRSFQTKGYEKAYREGLSKLQLRDNQEATLSTPSCTTNRMHRVVEQNSKNCW
jgi:hypothetical protein